MCIRDSNVKCAPALRIVNLLQVSQSGQFQVLKWLVGVWVWAESTIGDRRANRFKFQNLTGVAELQEEIGPLHKVGPSDQVESVAFPSSSEFSQKAEIAQYRDVYKRQERRELTESV